MTITVLSIVAGPFPATGAEQSLPFDFKVFSPPECEVLIGSPLTGTPLTLTDDYTVESDTDLTGAVVEGGSVTLLAGAVSAGENIYIVAKPRLTQEQVYSNTATRLSNLNEALDRATQQAQRAAFVGLAEGAGADLVAAAAAAGALAGEASAEAIGASKLDKNAGNLTSGEKATFRASISAAFSNAPNSSNFLSTLFGAPQPAVINRLGDRVLVGGAVVNDGAFPNVTKDWFTTHEIAAGRGNGIIVSAQAAVLTNSSPNARVGLVVAARTSPVSSDTGYVQSLNFSVVQDRTSSLIPATAGYAEAYRMFAASGSAQALELDTINFGSYESITPYVQSEKQTVALQLASGGELGTFDDSAAINVRNNGRKFGGALIVGHDAIVGSDGATGTGHAIQLALRHQMTWYNSAGDITSGVFGGNTSVTTRTRLAFIDQGACFLGPSESVVAEFPPVASVANYPSIQASGVGGAVQIEARGSDAKVNIRLLPKGAGTVQIAGALQNFADDAAAAAGGVSIEGLYRTGSVVKIRVS